MRKILIPSLLALTACPQVKKIDGGDGGGTVPAAVQSRFTMFCAYSAACHANGGETPNLSEGNTAQSITQQGFGGQYVVFGDVMASYMAIKMMPDPPDGDQMPLAGGPVPTPEDIAIIFGWIAGAPFPEDDTATDTMPMTMTDSGMDTMMESSGGDPLFCSLEAMDPAADAAAVIDAGDGADQIPTVVGEALLRNCGCHYTDNVPMDYGADYPGAAEFGTLADFQGSWNGTIPNPADIMMTNEAVSFRLDLAMPPATCSVDGTPGTDNEFMTQEDYDLLKDWLDAGAPDGASYP